MYLYFVRHGNPNYATDSLLPEGIAQAQAVAVRMKASGIEEIHCSPMGRARETAQPTADLLNLPVIIEPWAHELPVESRTTYPDGEARMVDSIPSVYMLQKAHRDMGLETALDSIDGFKGRQFKKCYQETAAGLDDMLARLGYVRNADGFYDTVSPNHRHVALFCHLNMMRAMLSHLINLPYQYCAGVFQGHFTSVTVVHFAAGPCYGAERPTVNEGALPNVFPVVPSIVSYGDVGHLYSGDVPHPVHYLHREAF